MSTEQLLAEIEELKKRLDNDHMILMASLGGQKILLQRIEILESFIGTLSDFARGTNGLLDQHLALFRDAGKSEPLPPTKGAPKDVSVA